MNAHVETSHAELVRSVSVQGLVAAREQIAQRVKEAARLLVEAEAIMEANKLHPLRHCIGNGSRYAVQADLCNGETERVGKYVDAQMWDRLLDESGLRTFMNQKRRTEWGGQIHDANVPEFTPENITATFVQIHDSRGDMVVEGVTDVYRRLSWNYKTNNPHKLGKKIIVDYFGEQRHGYYRINHQSCSDLDDLIRVFCLVNGEPEPDHRDGIYSLTSDAKAAGKSTLETKYLKLKWYKKGTVHVEFRDPKSVAAMNRMIGKKFPNTLSAKT